LGNSIASAALICWPLVALAMFLLVPARKAIVWSILGGYLFLPTIVRFDFPGVPPFDKDSIPALATFVLAMGLSKRGEFKWPSNPLVNGLMLLFVITPFFTGLTNQAPVVVGRLFIPGMTLYDSLSASVGNMIILLPFILGAGFLRNERSHRDLLVIYVILALIYSLPVLYEIRMSPTFMNRVYGLIDINYFLQSLRDGGYRAMVFLGHGLLVSTFIALGIVAAAGLMRQRVRIAGISAALALAVLAVVLVLNKSTGAIVLALLIAPALYLLPTRRFITIGFIISMIVLMYPMLRGANLVPTDQIQRLATSFSSDRGSSLKFRTENETLLLGRVAEKPVFGWGIFGRNRIAVDNGWSVTDITVTDGTWIIAIGQYGWVGYIAMFGLLSYPFFNLFRNRKQDVSLASVTLLAMMLLNLVDLLPNSSLRPMTWLIAGALSSLVAARQGAQRRQTSRAPTYQMSRSSFDWEQAGQAGSVLSDAEQIKPSVRAPSTD